MTEIRKSVLRTVRLDDDVWAAVKGMDCSLNQYLREVLLDGQEVKVERRIGARGAAKEVYDDVRDLATTLNNQGFDPRDIPGVSVGPPQATAGFPCRCVHSGCRGAKFTGTSRFANLCSGCQEKGHAGDPRNCAECFNDGGPA